MTQQIAYVGIGSNVDDSAGYVREGFSALERVGRVTAISDLYVTKPWGEREQADFVNAAAALETELSAPELVEGLLELERGLGRIRAARYGPRTIDFDLLLYGSLQLAQTGCSVPHPLMARRAFVLAPLAQIAPGVEVPGANATVAELLAALAQTERDGVRQIPGTGRLPAVAALDYDAPDGAARGYADLRPFSKFDQAVLDAALDALGQIAGRRVLDVGCGTGRFTRELAALGADVLGMDKSVAMLAAATAHDAPTGSRRPTYVRGDANDGLPNGGFDAVTSFYALQYFDIGRFFDHAKRTLASDGRLAVATFPHRHFVESEFARFFPSLAGLDLARFPSRQRVESALRDAGFASVGSTEIVIEMRDDPAQLIERVERKYLSSFHLLGDAEFRAGVAAMRREWSSLAGVLRNARAIVVCGQNRRTDDSERKSPV